MVKHLVVSLGFQALELVDGDLSVVNRDEVHKILILLNINIKLLDGGRVRIDLLLNARLRLKETLQSRLAKRHFLQLGLFVALFSLGFLLEDLLVGAPLHRIHHGLDVEHFTAEHHPRFLEWIAPLSNVFRDFVI